LWTGLGWVFWLSFWNQLGRISVKKKINWDRNESSKTYLGSVLCNHLNWNSAKVHLYSGGHQVWLTLKYNRVHRWITVQTRQGLVNSAFSYMQVHLDFRSSTCRIWRIVSSGFFWMIQQEAKNEKLKEILFARVNICRLVKGTVRAPDLSKREKSSSLARLLDLYLIFNTKIRTSRGELLPGTYLIFWEMKSWMKTIESERSKTYKFHFLKSYYRIIETWISYP